MALFKPLRGNRSALASQELHDGYAYFCTDDGSFHIDYVDADGNLQRKQVNAGELEALGYKIDNLPQADWNQDDPTAKDYIKNRPFYSSHLFELCNNMYISAPIEDFGGAYGIRVIYNNNEEYHIFTEDSRPMDIKVLFDGAEYNLTTTYFEPMGSSVAGNLAMLNPLLGTSFEATDEPFVIGFGYAGALIATDLFQSTTHNIAIFLVDDAVMQIPEKYIPDTQRVIDIDRRVMDIEGNYVTKYNGEDDTIILGSIQFKDSLEDNYCVLLDGSGLTTFAENGNTYMNYNADGIENANGVFSFDPDEGGGIFATRQWLASGNCEELYVNSMMANSMGLTNGEYGVEIYLNEDLENDIALFLPDKSGHIALTSSIAALHADIQENFVQKNDMPSLTFATVEDISTIFNEEEA